jgi:4-oxalocrotonate tautomerase
MPIITVKIFKSELTPAQTSAPIDDITEATIPYVGEVVRVNTWVLVEEVKSGAWGIGGKALGLAELRRIQQSAPPEQQPGGMRAPGNASSKGDRTLTRVLSDYDEDVREHANMTNIELTAMIAARGRCTRTGGKPGHKGDQSNVAATH